MNQLFSNLIYNNSIRNNSIRNNTIRNNTNQNRINHYTNSTRQNYTLNWRSRLTSRIRPSTIDNHTNNTDNIRDSNENYRDEMFDEPILNIPLNTQIPDNNTIIENINQNTQNTFNENDFVDNFFETIVYSEDNSNNIMRLNYINPIENNTTYQSIFEYNNYNIRFNHETVINPNEADFILQNILSNMFEEEIMNSSFNNITSPENDNITQEKIQKNIIEDTYENLYNTIKNDTCPISMESFSNNEKVCMFVKCNHGIHYDNKLQFIKLFKKCPLCNDMIY